jgi:hypothetical protein
LLIAFAVRKMLRCPPSRINLTASDIAAFEQRQAVRKLQRLLPPQTSNIRLSPGPARSTSLSLVAEEQNIGRQRAASSSSEATLHDSQKDDAEETPRPIENQRRPSGFVEKDLRPSHLQLPVRSSPRRQVDSFYGDSLDVGATNVDGQETQHTSRLECIADRRPSAPEVEMQFRVTSMPDPLTSTNALSLRLAAQTRLGDQLLASTRARRRAHPIDLIPEDPQEVQNGSSEVPQLILPREDELQPPNQSLDPGAPVFVPRTRFGTATTSSVDGSLVAWDPQLNSDDGSQASLSLRIRSSSERNSGLPHASQRRLARQRSHSSSGSHQSQRLDENQQRQRRRSRTTDQAASRTVSHPHIERYPLLRPVSLSTSQRIASRPSSRNVTPLHTFRMVLPSTIPLTQQESDSAVLDPPSSDGSNRGTLSTNQASATVRSATPLVLSRGRSTPNFQQHTISPERVYSRSSSLSWKHSDSASVHISRVPSMVSAASGISRDEGLTRHSSRERLDAAAEFLRMRNSPLDDLTERLSRLSTSRPRSVGRSWERPPSNKSRVSLLTGDPFRPDMRNQQDIAHKNWKTSPAQHQPESHGVQSNEYKTSAADLVALSIALPPTSSLPSSPHDLPSTPPTGPRHETTQCISGAQASDSVPCGSPPSAIKRKPVPGVSKTPKVNVYDDSKPSNTQPQTPAEVKTSTRRGKARSETAIHHSPVEAKHNKVNSPSVIPERHPHRNTFPPATTISAQTGSAATPDSRSSGSSQPHLLRRSRRRAQASSDQVENNLLEGHLPRLEEEHRTWMNRQDGGDLDITPPREGRFEQYLR